MVHDFALEAFLKCYALYKSTFYLLTYMISAAFGIMNSTDDVTINSMTSQQDKVVNNYWKGTGAKSARVITRHNHHLAVIPLHFAAARLMLWDLQKS